MNTRIKNLPQQGRSLLVTLLSFGYFALALTPAYASDTEVYSQTANPNAGASPTVMLSLDASSTMDKCLTSQTDCGPSSATPNGSRLKALQAAVKAVLQGDATATPAILPAPGNVKMGLTLVSDATDAAHGVKVALPMRALDSYTTVYKTVTGGGLEVVTPLASANDNAYQETSAASATLASSNSRDLYLAHKDSGNPSGDLYVGLRFTDLQIPKGAVILNAYIEFTAAVDTPAGEQGGIRWQLDVEDLIHAPDDFSVKGMRSSPPQVDRTYFGGVLYDGDNAWIKDQKYQVPVTSLVQHVVDLPNYCGNQAMSFRISNTNVGGGNRERIAYSFGSAPDADKKPVLKITYAISAANAANSCIWEFAETGTTLNIAKLDDIEWDTGSTPVIPSGADLLPYKVNGGVHRNTALRFVLPLYNNADGDTVTLNEAKLYLKGSISTPAGNANQLSALTLSHFDTANLPAFCSNATTCTKPATSTTGAAAWTPTTRMSAGTEYSVDVTSRIQGLIARAGWARNNAVGFHLTSSIDTDKTAGFVSADASTSNGPRLVIKYKQKKKQVPPIDGSATVVEETTKWRDVLLKAINGLTANGNATAANGITESGRYLMGITKTGLYSNTETYTGETYNSPIDATAQCSGNYVYWLSAGDPASNSGTRDEARPFVATGETACDDNSNYPIKGNDKKLSWNCMVTSSSWLVRQKDNQKKARIRMNTVLLGTPEVEGDTVAKANLLWNFDQVAQAGQGKFYNVTTVSDLVTSLSETIKGALDEGATISAPGVAVNQLSRLTHLDQLYYSVFDPDTHPFWRGNVKRFRLGFQNTTPTVFDAVGSPAIDTTTSFFRDTSKSWWGESNRSADGQIARNGGAAKVLPYPDIDAEASTFVLNGQTQAKRRMYTFLSGYPTLPSSAASSLTVVDPDNSTFNTAAKSQMGVSNDNTYKRLIYWLMGYKVDVYKQGALNTDSITIDADVDGDGTSDIDTPLRREMGGALHSRPILVNYGYEGTNINAALSDPNLQDNTLIFSTLEGVMHAVDTKTGVEEFSFIPKEKLGTVATLADDFTSTSEPQYGMDLTWTVLREDKNGDFKITLTEGGTATGDKVWIYGGMRMGGRNYYALDVTDRSAPKLKWVIEGGTGKFANLGQTWSQPSYGNVKINGVLKTVLFIGGGYDPDHESKTYGALTGDDQGNQVYIVDADTGEVYWWASSSSSGSNSPSLTVSDLKFSVPSEIKPFDYNGDGLVDTLYFGDMGGQVFRVDPNNANTSAANLGVRVRTLAKLGQTSVVIPTVADQRRFYEAPSVARFDDATGKYAMVAIGSGYRSHPLVGASASDINTDDYFYMLRDNDVVRSDIATGSASATATASLQATITPANLVTVANPASVTADGVNTTGYMGWKADLPDVGEKVLASPIIYLNKVFFTTYVPRVVDPNPCLPIYGRTKSYELGALNASLPDSNNDGVIGAGDRSMNDSVVLGLGGEVQLIVLPPSSIPSNLGGCGTIVLVGTNASCGDNRAPTAFKRLRWYNKTKN